ncbi:PREDICTED: DNA repair protein RAD51 homolog 3 isoform X4 [Nelumbo nucifera]|uniref:DNA repair protein RAD51 homolog 3 n=1 Tax=Nelumbo nucifera TaxID=4432 RepID=A0A1U8AN34_NELNU|nr:PREDICTED: DNA repair protein RAD51 homolog 3 isoform X4 [Nelumbo nucifera]
MEVSSLPLSPSQRGKLIAAGYTTLSSLSSVSAPDLARDLNISEHEAIEILKVSSQSSKKIDGCHAIVTGAQTAWDMLYEEEFMTRITTSCADLDNILGGGISCKEVTEIGGVPGIGKTQLGIQLAVNVQIPIDYGGLGGKAVYIDTEGSFMVERVFQVAEACIEDMPYNYPQKDFQARKNKMQPENFLANIFYFRVCSYTEQIALINYLDKFVAENKDVVLLNQVTTKFNEGSYQLTLALGDSWSHACTNRIILYWNGNERYAYIDKSPSLQSASAAYSVTGKGIRDAASHCKRVRIM